MMDDAPETITILNPEDYMPPWIDGYEVKPLFTGRSASTVPTGGHWTILTHHGVVSEGEIINKESRDTALENFRRAMDFFCSKYRVVMFRKLPEIRTYADGSVKIYTRLAVI
jgi:hypothetical protein